MNKTKVIRNIDSNTTIKTTNNKMPKASIKVFGSVEFVFWVFIVNVMLSTVKTARIPANSSG